MQRPLGATRPWASLRNVVGLGLHLRVPVQFRVSDASGEGMLPLWQFNECLGLLGKKLVISLRSFLLHQSTVICSNAGSRLLYVSGSCTG